MTSPEMNKNSPEFSMGTRKEDSQEIQNVDSGRLVSFLLISRYVVTATKVRFA